MADDLTALAQRIAQGRLSAPDALEGALERASRPANQRTFVRRFDEAARAAAEGTATARRLGLPIPPLAGLAVSIKDLFDVAGQPTTAGSASMADALPAATDCPAVARLRAAGAALVGHTNLSEFAFSGVGINPHHGTPPNPVTAVIDAQPRIPGGSSSGAAVSLATGAAWAALGSDTGGSIRIPAALQGLVGFKNTARLTPLAGAIPLSTSLDTVCALTVSVRDAVLVHEILAARHVSLRRRPLSALRLGVPTTILTDGLDADVAAAFEAALERLSAAGAQIERLALPELTEIGRINARGTLAAAESWAWHRARLATRESQYDPRVAFRIRAGEAMGAADYIDLRDARSEWIGRVERALSPFDAMLSPTVPIVAPPIEPLIDSDEKFFATNAALLRNPSVVNFLDGCALSLPCHEPGRMPVGLMVWAGALADDAVLDASLAIEAVLGHATR
jgi:amidase/aspartyl-tRNA(Asn)/glutamyl-tRNA(Gln) amidotransferase subunit A